MEGIPKQTKEAILEEAREAFDYGVFPIDTILHRLENILNSLLGNDWIPIEDGLPKVPGKRYLVLGKNITGRRTIDEASLKWPSTRGRFFHPWRVSGITHWMERPPMPEEENVKKND